MTSRLAAVLMLGVVPLRAAVFDVTANGAKGDGKALDRDAINKTIELASKAGGGTVHFPAGTYLTGSIQLRSNVTLEFEPGCVADLRRALEKIAPANHDYAHNARWGDDNGYSHLRSALVGTARSFPVEAGRILVGTWQQIVLCDFDDRERDRQVLVTVVGE